MSSLKKPELVCILHVHYNVPMVQLNINRPPLILKLEDMIRTMPFAALPAVAAEQAARAETVGQDDETDGEESGEEEEAEGM